MKSLLLLILSGVAGNAVSAALPTAGQIAVRIHAEGGFEVIKDLQAKQGEFEMILADVDSGECAWLSVALLLKSFSDAGSAEGLAYAVARALGESTGARALADRSWI